MKQSLLFFSLIFCIHQSIAQNFQFDKVPVKLIDSIESIAKADKFQYDYPIGVAEDYFPNRTSFKLGQPIVYRKKIDGGKLETSFYYSLPDSTLRLIEYWWEGTSTNKKFGKKILKKGRKQISRHMHSKGIHTLETDNKAEKNIWKNDSTHVQQFWVLGRDNYYFIRVLISWTNGNE
jgi:hypothetical protein